MQEILNKLNQCIEIKKEADALSSFKAGKKMELADQAINISFEVVGGVIDSVVNLQEQVKILQKHIAELQVGEAK